MTIEEIKELLQIFNESGVADDGVARGENRLRLRRAGTTQEFVVGTAPVGCAVRGVSVIRTGFASGCAPEAASPNAGATSSSAGPGTEAPGGGCEHVLVKSADRGNVL